MQEGQETREDLDRKIERWKAGEKVDGITDIYQGGEVDTICVLGAKPNDI